MEIPEILILKINVSLFIFQDVIEWDGSESRMEFSRARFSRMGFAGARQPRDYWLRWRLVRIFWRSWWRGKRRDVVIQVEDRMRSRIWTCGSSSHYPHCPGKPENIHCSSFLVCFATGWRRTRLFFFKVLIKKKSKRTRSVADLHSETKPKIVVLEVKMQTITEILSYCSPLTSFYIFLAAWQQP